MKTILITGSSGLIGSEATKYFSDLGFRVVGIDNDMRSYFFGEAASTINQKIKLMEKYPNFISFNKDIRDIESLKLIFQEFNTDIKGIIHTAAQPSHDWAAKEPLTDFGVNAIGTVNLLECYRNYCSDAVFIFTSTNKVYGDLPNNLPLEELDTRWEINPNHKYFLNGIDEKLSIDNSKHSIFGASKVAADIMVQEYGKYFGLKTAVFRGGCLTGPAHSGAELHGFLAYLVKCAVNKTPYTIFGYNGKQVRDNIHSKDLVSAFYEFYLNPRFGEVYNIGGSRFSNVSMLEAIDSIYKLSGHRINYSISETNRIGDHIWYISDISKFQSHYPNWNLTYNIDMILSEMIETAEKSAC